MIFFTSDTHYDHANVIRYSNRPFPDIEEMNATLIANHNSIVKNGDTVYHLGDFCFSKTPMEFKRRLNGNMIHIKGNHDKALEKAKIPMLHYHELRVEEFLVHGRPLKIVLFHYPIAVWNKKHYSSLHLHGHSHANYKYSFPQSKEHGRIIDVGVDAVATALGGGALNLEDYRPVSLDEVLAWSQLLDNGPSLDHHSEEGREREI